MPNLFARINIIFRVCFDFLTSVKPLPGQRGGVVEGEGVCIGQNYLLTQFDRKGSLNRIWCFCQWQKQLFDVYNK